jgi:hypothetical protein
MRSNGNAVRTVKVLTQIRAADAAGDDLDLQKPGRGRAWLRDFLDAHVPIPMVDNGLHDLLLVSGSVT